MTLTITDDAAQPVAATPPDAGTTLASAWRRIAAIAIDALPLALAGALLGFIGTDTLVQLGAGGRVVGFAIAWLYFGLGNSRLAGGATLGKRLLGIRVVDFNGAPLGVGRSLARSPIYLLPYFLNGLPLGPGQVGLATLTGVVVFGVGGAVVYLLFFNRITRQSLHDFAARSLVIRTPWRGAPAARPWRGHVLIAAAIVLVASAAGIAIPRVLGNSDGSLKRMSDAQVELSRDSRAQYVGITSRRTVGTRAQHSELQVDVRLAYPPPDFDDAIAHFGRAIFSTPLDMNELDSVVISVAYGYDLGIASSFQRAWRRDTVATWREKVR